ncbi:hypothetical protein GAN18_10850 [Mycobacterium kubicae]|nr:hypothetical protein GAN18_10850 [Mycobacterium kubicae]
MLLSRSPANAIWGTRCERDGTLRTVMPLLVNQGAGVQSPRSATMDGPHSRLRPCPMTSGATRY